MLVLRQSSSLLAFLLAACGSGEGPTRTASGPLQGGPLIERAAEIKDKLAEFRGGAFTRPLHIRVITREQYRLEVKSDIDRSISAAQDRAMSRELSQLGFFPDTATSMKSYWGDFYGGFPAGYYVPGHDSIYVLSEFTDNAWFLQKALPHELIHAFQDQHLRAFSGSRTPGTPAYYESDFNLARRYLFEGDAEFSSFSFYLHHDLGQTDHFQIARDDARNRRSLGFAEWKKLEAKDYLFAPMSTPYEAGMVMAGDIHAEGGWEALNALYHEAGRSSLAALTGVPRPPAPVDFSGLYSLFDTVGAYVDDFGHGSLQTMALFIPFLNEARFLKGMGWRGDRFFFLMTPAQRFGTLVWVQVYADATDALFAFEALEQLLPGRFQGTTYRSSQTRQALAGYDQGFRLEWQGLATALIRRGNEVWWVENAGEKTEAVLAALRDMPRGPLAKRGPSEPGGGGKIWGPDLKRRFFHPWGHGGYR